MSRMIPALFALTVPFAAPFTAAAEAPEITRQLQTGAETHDGFFLRMTTGPGGIGAAFEVEGGTDYSVSGSGSQFELSIGHAITKNLILHADFLGATTNDLDGEDDNNLDLNLNDHELVLGGVGGGVTYYWMPYNIYLSGSIMAIAAQLTDTSGANDVDLIEVGYGALGRVKVGKEWWVSENWGLGVALSVYGGGGGGEDNLNRDVDAGFGGGALEFSATFN
ncbi:MAG: hypothetical protein ACE366_13775 [Bradymonadia bacterium]